MLYRFLNRILKNYLPTLVLFFLRIKSLNSLFSKKKDRIAIINTHDISGGAAKIAYTLFINFKNADYFVGFKKTNHPGIFVFQNKLNNWFFRWFNELEKISGWLDFSKIGFLFILKNKQFQSSSIVHLHNTHGYYLSPVIIRFLGTKKTIIWTLHDEFLLTGHCSVTQGCDKWRFNCGKCPNMNTYPSLKIDTSREIALYNQKTLKIIKPIIVTPSRWLANRVLSKYPFLMNKVHVIHNGIDENIFKPLSKLELRTKHVIPSNAFVILFVAELSTKNPFKGGEVIRELASTYINSDTIIITVGGEEKGYCDGHIVFPYIFNEKDLVEFYNLADVMVYPTKADNLPLVVLESMSCGVPVIASKIGGIPEIIQDNINGYLVEDYQDVNSFIKILDEIKKSPQKLQDLSHKSRDTILRNFTMNEMIEKYSRLYEVHF
jgi:glycosyltransferase involved in cell wall biosynthesis